MKQINFSFLLAALLSMVGVRSFAYDFEIEGIRYNVVSIEKLTCEVTQGSYSGNIYIPTYVQYNNRSLMVVGIGAEAFSNCSSITSITLPKQLEYIGYRGFYMCSALSELKIPESLREIGREAFYGCSIKKVFINDVAGWCSISYESTPINTNTVFYLNDEPCENLQIPDNIEIIKSYAFKNNSTIKKVIFPQSIRRIEEAAFSYCRNLESIEIPNQCNFIGAYAFQNCHIKGKELLIPAAVDTIGTGAFGNCFFNNLLIENSKNTLVLYTSSFGFVKQVTLHRNFKNRASDYSSGSYSIIKDSLETIIIGSEVSKIPSGTLYNKNVKKLIIEDANSTLITPGRSLGNYYTQGEFNNCPLDYLYLGRSISFRLFGIKGPTMDSFENSVTTLIIGDEVKDFGYAFEKTNVFSSVKKMDLGKSFNYLPDMSGSKALECIIVRNPIPPTAKGFANTTYLHCDLLVPDGCKERYMNADVWKSFWNIYEINEYVSGLKTTKESSSKTSKTDYYTIEGTKIDSPQKGFNIIKIGDGITKKVIVR